MRRVVWIGPCIKSSSVATGKGSSCSTHFPVGWVREPTPPLTMLEGVEPDTDVLFSIFGACEATTKPIVIFYCFERRLLIIESASTTTNCNTVGAALLLLLK